MRLLGIRSVGRLLPSQRSTSRRARFSRTTGRTSPTTATSPASKAENMDQLTFLQEEPPANHSPAPGSVEDWMTTVATWPSSFAALLGAYAPAGSHGKMSLAFSPAFPTQLPIRVSRQVTWMRGRGMNEWSRMNTKLSKAMRSDASWPGYKSWGMASPGECLTLSTSEWNHTLAPSRSEGAVCSLSDILETGDHLLGYCLSPKACAGILRRAEKRGKELPPHFKHALLQVVQHGEPTSSPMED